VNPSTLRDLRRSQIIKVARQIVAERGLEALTIGGLEGSLDFSRGVITYHFKNKEEIVFAVFNSAIEEIDAATMAMVKKSTSSQDKIAALVRANVHGFLAKAEAGRILLSFWGRLQADGRAKDRNATLYARYRSTTAALIESGQRSGDFRGDIDADACATVIVGMVIGIATQTIFEDDAVDVDAAVNEAAGMLADRLRP